MDAPPSISVVVPFFGRERSIRACIESLLAQVPIDGRAEIILVDNNSTDRSATIAAEYDDVVLLRESRPGAYAARNTGIRASAGSIVAFTDADCVADRNWLQAIERRTRAPSTQIVIGHCRYPRSASTALRLLGAYENAKADYVIRRGPASRWFAYANNMAVRASVFDRLGPFQEWDRAADSELVHRLAAAEPEFRLEYDAAMRVVHTEFTTMRGRARRLARYKRTNARIDTFRELTLRQRLAIALHLFRGRRDF